MKPYTDLLPHQRRVVHEYAADAARWEDTAEKLAKLEAFMSADAWMALDDDERARLNTQATAMHAEREALAEKLDVLARRLSAF